MPYRFYDCKKMSELVGKETKKWIGRGLAAGVLVALCGIALGWAKGV